MIDFVKEFDNPSDPNALINEAVELMFGVSVSQSIKDSLKTNYLLLGQASDYYWTDAYNTYIANPSTTDPEGRFICLYSVCCRISPMLTFSIIIQK